MALTRRALKAMGIEDEKIDEIISMHTETVDGLKADVDRYKADAKAMPGVQKQLEQAKADLEAGKKDSYKVKYEVLKEEFEDYKKAQTKKESHAAKETAYRALLKAAGVSEKRIDAVLKVSDVDGVELDDKGQIKDADKLTESVKTEWADFIVTTTTKGADTANPPANNGGSGTMTKDQIMAIKDRSERRAAIAANMDLFTNNTKGD